MTDSWGWRQLLMLLLVVVSCGALIALLSQPEPASAKGSSTAMQADILELRAEVLALETRIAEQAAKASEEKQLMIRLLDASTQRLDALCRAIEAGPVTPAATPGQSANGEGAPTPARKGGADEAPEAPGSSSFFGDIDFVQAAVTFLAVALLLLVAIVVFFPGRLRGTIPEVEYTAEPDPVEVPEFRPPATSTQQPPATQAAPVDAPGPAIVPMERRFPDPPVVEGNPVPHNLSIGLGDQQNLQGLVSVLDSYLNTEPYILRNPAPRVAMEKGELHLKFYALPTLSKAEHALLDATVQRLHPGGATSPKPAESWVSGSDPDAHPDPRSAPVP